MKTEYNLAVHRLTVHFNRLDADSMAQANKEQEQQAQAPPPPPPPPIKRVVVAVLPGKEVRNNGW
jgi:hypothetical protein